MYMNVINFIIQSILISGILNKHNYFLLYYILISGNIEIDHISLQFKY